jgi:foldase protein PrsA
MLTLAAVAVAVSVSAPDYSATVEDREVRQWTRIEGGSEERALRGLIEAAWMEGEARERGIMVTGAQVLETYKEAKRDDFAREADFRRFLRRSGHTRETLRRRVRIDLVTQAVRDQITQPAALGVTPEQVDAYVDAHPQQVPERREVRLIIAGTRADGRRARRDVKRGVPWRTVERRYATDRTPAPVRVEPGVLHPKLDTAVFAAERNAVGGPISTRVGHYVFKVIEIRPARPRSRAAQEAQAWEHLASEAQQEALDDFRVQFTAKWRARTRCAPRFADHEYCAQPPTVQHAS